MFMIKFNIILMTRVRSGLSLHSLRSIQLRDSTRLAQRLGYQQRTVCASVYIPSRMSRRYRAARLRGPSSYLELSCSPLSRRPDSLFVPSLECRLFGVPRDKERIASHSLEED